SKGETRKCLRIPRVIRERRQKPSLCLGGELRPIFSSERDRCTRQCLVNARVRTQSDNSIATCRFEQEDLELSADLLGYILVNRSEIIMAGFMSTCPQVLPCHPVADPHVDPQNPRTTLQDTPCDHIPGFSWVWCRDIRSPMRFVGRPSE